MRTRERNWVILAIVVAAAFVCYFTWPSEPEIQGRKLSAWLEDLADLARTHPSIQGADLNAVQNWQRQHDRATAAVRNIGSNSVPYLVKWVHSGHSSAFRDDINALLAKQSILRIELPDRRDLSDLSIAGFEALGSNAAAAVPQLSKLLLDPELSGTAAACLRRIGSPGLPMLAASLTNANKQIQWVALLSLSDDTGPKLDSQFLPILLSAITNSQCRFPEEALLRLGDMGSTARDTLPWLEAVVLDESNPLAGPAMRVLAELSPARDQWLSLLAERADQPRFAPHAAFALARVGSSGVPALLELLTNRDATIQNAAVAALSLEVMKVPAQFNSIRHPPRFAQSCAIYESRFQRLNSIPGSNWRPSQRLHSLANNLAGLLQHPDPAVRVQVVNVLAQYGYHSAAALSQAAADQDSVISNAARSALANLDVQLQDGAIVRGPTDKKRVALIFPGDDQIEGGEEILDELSRRRAGASFFFTPRSRDRSLATRVYHEGLYLGPHLDERLFYSDPKEPPRKTSLDRPRFDSDFGQSVHTVQMIQIVERYRTGVVQEAPPHYFAAPPGFYDLPMAVWAADSGYVTVCPTPGLAGDSDIDPRTVSWESTLENAVSRDQEDPHGLNGCILLFHLPADSARAARCQTTFVALLDYLAGKGYTLVRIDELLEGIQTE